MDFQHSYTTVNLSRFLLTKQPEISVNSSSVVDCGPCDACSPMGEVFRARLRQFPALVNCCTIDWFSEWPPDALQSVAMRVLSDLPDLDASDAVLDGLVSTRLNFFRSV